MQTREYAAVITQMYSDSEGSHALLGRPTPTLPLSKEEMFLYNFNENACDFNYCPLSRLRAHVFWVCLLVWGISITHVTQQTSATR